MGRSACPVCAMIVLYACCADSSVKMSSSASTMLCVSAALVVVLLSTAFAAPPPRTFHHTHTHRPPHRSAHRHTCSVVSVCLSVTSVSPAETDEPIEMLFGVWTPEYAPIRRNRSLHREQ